MADGCLHLEDCLVCSHTGCCDQSLPLLRRNPLWFRASLPAPG
jgi:hypothetical protein